MRDTLRAVSLLVGVCGIFLFFSGIMLAVAAVSGLLPGLGLIVSGEALALFGIILTLLAAFSYRRLKPYR